VRTFVWDGENIIRQTQRDYTYNPQRYGELISQSGSFHHFDALGSTMQMTDGDAAVTNQYLYRAFGEETDLSGDDAVPNRFRWVGKLGYYWQPDLGNYWLRARVYDPQRGRFVSRDPVRRGANRYRFPQSNPVSVTDASGRQRGGKRPQHYEPVQLGESILVIGGGGPVEMGRLCPGEPEEGGWRCETRVPGGWVMTVFSTAGAGGSVEHDAFVQSVRCDCKRWFLRNCSVTVVHRKTIRSASGSSKEFVWPPVDKKGKCVTNRHKRERRPPCKGALDCCTEIENAVRQALEIVNPLTGDVPVFRCVAECQILANTGGIKTGRQAINGFKKCIAEAALSSVLDQALENELGSILAG